MWKTVKTKIGFLVGNLLLIGPAWQPDCHNDLRPFWWYYLLSEKDTFALLKWHNTVVS